MSELQTEPLAIGLLVDSDELFLSALQRVLRRRRIETVAATSAQCALRLPVVARLDFALVDLNLQVSSHPRLVQTLHRLYPTARLILMTDRDGMRASIRGGGAVAYLPKAMSTDRLLEALAVPDCQPPCVVSTRPAAHESE